MDLWFADDAFRRTPECLVALQLYQHGYLGKARQKFSELALLQDYRDFASFYLVLIDRALSPPNGSGWTLNLPKGGPTLWETDWIRLLFGGAITAEVIDDRTGVAADRSIIVDRVLDPEKDDYYRRNFEEGVRQVLVHLSDELYDDSCSSYRWFERVYRNYWTPILADLAPVSFFPLGYKAGFARAGDAPLPSAQRPYLWSFVGDPNKQTRALMLRHMRSVSDGFEHLISGWNASDSLSTDDYRGILDQSVFAPCPAGGNLDCYRIYEAFEAGCIPVVQQRPGHPYFDRLLPGHPMIVLSHWSEAPTRLQALLESGDQETLRQACQDWWAEHKARLIAQVSADLNS